MRQPPAHIPTRPAHFQSETVVFGRKSVPDNHPSGQIQDKNEHVKTRFDMAKESPSSESAADVCGQYCSRFKVSI